jgi:hypothetical protein
MAGRDTRLILTLLAALVALTGCGADDGAGGDSAGTTEAVGVGEIVRAGSTAQFANCRDWRRGTVEERYATIEDIRGQLTPQRSETARSDLPDEDAYRLFEKTCATGFSDSMRLYKLYATAEAYAPLNPEVGD